MIYTEYGSLLRLNVAISGFLRYLWLTAKYGLRQTSESRFLTLPYGTFPQIRMNALYNSNHRTTNFVR